MTLPEILDENASLRQERRSMRDQGRRYIARINELEARADKLEKACINVVDLLDAVEACPCPEDAIRRLKEIRHRRYEAIASIDRQIESLEAFL